MGVNESKIEQQNVPKINNSNEWRLVTTKQDEIYGDIKIFKHQSSKEVRALKSLFFQDQTQYKTQLKTIQSAAVFDVTLNNTSQVASVVKVLDIETQVEDNTCSTF